jgi:prepilin-type N-terminal cleavage/methylation domain-containing protein
MIKMIERNRPRAPRGFTLVELLITTLVMSIVGFAIGVVVVDAQTGWNVMYRRINSDIVSDGYAARNKFDSVMRSASSSQVVLAGDGGWIEVYSYASAASSAVDRYWRFYVSGGDLYAEYGQLEPRSTLSTETVCENVSDCTFQQFGQAIQMTLALDNGTQTNTVVTSAVAHNR